MNVPPLNPSRLHINITSAAAAICHSDVKQKGRGGKSSAVYEKRLIDMSAATTGCLLLTLTNVSADDE